MALLQPDGTIIRYVRSANANADMNGIKASKKRKFVVDRSRLIARENKRLERLEAKLRMRKDIDKYIGR
jgi:hypothetical protein